MTKTCGRKKERETERKMVPKAIECMKKKRKKLVGRHPCAVVFTHAADGWWREKERKKRKRADARTAATKDDDTDFLLEAKFFSVFFMHKTRKVSSGL